MKLIKFMSLLLAVCLLGSALVACNCGKEQETESVTESETVPSISITLKIEAPKGSDDESLEDTFTCEAATLGAAIEYYCVIYKGINEDASELFQSKILKRIGEWDSGDDTWTAYLEGAGGGRNNPLSTVYDHPIKDGETYVLYIAS